MLSKKPTREEELRIRHIQDRGCVPCWLESKLQSRKWVPEPCDIHHADQDNWRHTYGNCPWHHRGVRKNNLSLYEMARVFGPSMALHPQKYRARYGTEDDLLAYQATLLLKSDSKLLEAIHGTR
jgi:hypothetical protein